MHDYCFVTVKINLDNILSGITFDYDPMKRVPYVLKHYQLFYHENIAFES